MDALVELRLLELAIRLLDPRKWRLRLLQGGGAAALGGWVWWRAVTTSEELDAVRDAKRRERAARIRAENARREAGRSAW